MDTRAEHPKTSRTALCCSLHALTCRVVRRSRLINNQETSRGLTDQGVFSGLEDLDVQHLAAVLVDVVQAFVEGRMPH